MQLGRIPFFALVLSLGLTACGPAGAQATEAGPIPLVPADLGIVAEGRVEPVRFTELALSASGLVSDVLITEGELVSAGDVIARLKSSEARTLADAQADALQELTGAYQVVRDAQYSLDNFDVPYEFAGQTATEAVSTTLEKLDAARDAFEPYEDLSEKRLELTDNEKEDESKIYRDTAKLYKKRLDDAWSRYRKAIQWLGLESDLETASARLLQAQTDHDSLEDASFAEDTAGIRAALANAELRAPFPGTITNLDLKVGEFAGSGQPVVTIADLSSWVVKTTDLTEIDVVSVSEGQPVTISLDAVPGVTLNAYVLEIGQNFSEKQGDVVYEVTILLTEPPAAIRWGMTAEVTFSK